MSEYESADQEENINPSLSRRLEVEAETDPSRQIAFSSNLDKSKSQPESQPQPQSQTADASSDLSDEDDMPDYSILSSLVNKAKQQSLDAAGANTNSNAIVANPHIPKRGEKDFEPTGVAGQNRALENSRTAMLEAISGERRVASKALSFAIWDPIKNRAVVHSFKGQMFGSIGITVRRSVAAESSPSTSKPKVVTTFELLPEETLYLVERGALQCCVEVSDPSSRQPDSEFAKFAKSGMGLTPKVLQEYNLENLVPMTVQEAFSRILGKDGCTRERYQVYAYCKRLGYIVQRASITDELRAAANSTSKESSSKLEPKSDAPRCPLHPSNLLAGLLRSLPAMLDFPIEMMRSLDYRLKQSVGWIRETAVRVLRQEKAPVRGTGLLGIGGRKWDSFDSVFSKLQIIPSGHDRPHSHPRSRPNSETAFPVYYYAWRPATHYKKSSPPLPEFRISITDARTTSLPNSFEFTEMFEQVPLPGETIAEEDLKIAQEQKTKNDEAYGRKAAAKMREKERERKLKKEGKLPTSVDKPESRDWLRPLLDWLHPYLDLFHHLPPGSSSSSSQTRRPFAQRPRPPNPFPPLKAGRRNVILAVVDNGTTSMLRFGESEFHKWKLAPQRVGNAL